MLFITFPKKTFWDPAASMGRVFIRSDVIYLKPYTSGSFCTRIYIATIYWGFLVRTVNTANFNANSK
jgi:hypothetical protein